MSKIIPCFCDSVPAIFSVVFNDLIKLVIVILGEGAM